MKKYTIAFLMLILLLTLSIYVIFIVFEDRLVEPFKKQIIDKANINLNFSKIHISLLKNFPYGSFILEDAYIYYTPDKLSDTLLFTKKLSFKINIINLFRSIYEFREIVLSDGIVNIKSEKVKLLFSKDRPNNMLDSYVIKTEKIKIKKCLVKYYYEKKITIDFHLRDVACSGHFSTNALAVKLSFDVDSVTGVFNGLKFKNDDHYFVSSNIKEKNNHYFSENGSIKYGSIKLRFSFNYSYDNDSLKATLSSNRILVKELEKTNFHRVNKFVSKGGFSFDSYYTTNINRLDSQKLIVSYVLNDIMFVDDKNIIISKLNGITTLLGGVEKNISEINNFSLNYSGVEFSGSAKIKNLPRPFLLIDTKIKNTKELKINNEIILNGNITGSLKLLVKLNDIYKLNDSTLSIIKLNSKINVDDVSVENYDKIKEITGEINVVEDNLIFTGNGKLFNSSFKGGLEIPDFINVLLHHQSPASSVILDIDRINLDSILLGKEKGVTTQFPACFTLKSKIKKLIYRGSEINNLILELGLSNGKYTCDRFSMNAYSGNISGNFSFSSNVCAVSSLLFQNIDIHTLFKSFNNFEQSVITYSNISGSLSGKADLSFFIEKDRRVNLLSIKASSKLMVENGMLSGLNQFEKLSRALNLKEVESIQFKTLENNINVENGMVYIPSMKISSDAINFQLSGQHNFSGGFSYFMKVNLKEILAKKFANKKNIYSSDYEIDNKHGLNLYFKLYGNSESFKISIDKKGSLNRFKNNIIQERLSLKNLIKDEFKLSKSDSSIYLDSFLWESPKKVDTINNKTKKKPFRIEWDEIDSTKKL